MTTLTASKLPSGGAHSTGWFRLALVAILLAAFALRLYRLGGDSLWYDETFSAYLARQAVPDLIAHTGRDIHPPGYYLILHAWQLLTAASSAHGFEYMLAWASLLPALLIVTLTIAIARGLGGQTAALAAGAYAAIHPPQIWFSQEVRMYAWGALFILLTLWAVLRLMNPHGTRAPRPGLAWLVYVAAATAALYTVYYALFWLIAVNIFVLLGWAYRRPPRVGAWLSAQAAVLLAYLPWLPTFIRQAIDPPVPPWREPWQSVPEAVAAINESLAALAVGHTPPFGWLWPWSVAILVLGAIVIVYAKERPRQTGIIVVLAFGPLALLLVATALEWPIYHVRYVSLYAPALPLLVGSAMSSPARARRTAAVVLALLLLGAAGSLRELWFNPAFAADDHRSAVADLAAKWRPGDAILINAGWVYTALDVYWPRELTSPDASLPPDLGLARRLGAQPTPDTTAVKAPLMVRTGSINAPADLGWALPESDFFTIPAGSATAALDDLARQSTRLWHYRLYDTVNDPAGVLRAALQAHGDPSFSRAYPGPSYILLERYDISPLATTPAAAAPLVDYANGLALVAVELPTQSRAGQYLYVTLAWRGIGDVAVQDLAVSVRANRAAHTIAQIDVPLADAAGSGSQTLALPIAAGTPPGALALTLVVYYRADLRPIELPDGSGEFDLGEVSITLPYLAPPTPPALARFDYIDLVAARAAVTGGGSDGLLATHWTWRPRPSPYQDDYTAVVMLRTATGAPAAEWRFPLGGAEYPSGAWAAGYAVNQEELLPLPANLGPGSYTLALSLRRAADDLLISASRWGWPSRPFFDVASVTVPDGVAD
jgi:4-amino-4-deoxy-L-arabinose transferase-like glycosyltransferase